MRLAPNPGQIVIIVWAVWTAQPNASAQLFEFCDDFTKDLRLQRDPYEERIETP